jgi:hypothetical protein
MVLAISPVYGRPNMLSSYHLSRCATHYNIPTTAPTATTKLMTIPDDDVLTAPPVKVATEADVGEAVSATVVVTAAIDTSVVAAEAAVPVAVVPAVVSTLVYTEVLGAADVASAVAVGPELVDTEEFAETSA